MDFLKPASAQLVRIVAAVPADAWSTSTPCDLTIHEVVNHVVAGNIFAVRLLAGASAADATAGLDGDYLGEDPLAAVTTSCEHQVAAFASADQSRPLHHPSRDISFETFVRFRLGELVVHGWDVAVGAGLDPALDASVVAGLWAMVEPHVEDMRQMGTFGKGATTSSATSVQARLLDAFGRHA
ncbi:TIGR03086 family metal-binding protein [Kribbella deserti]|uniref:TIGR03086 family metal-binding protein n=1 Tax=Kribbella deserti TaxID=1926257 RepID=A0ABV6QKF9_9ACTN